jgi:hypothetical protein
VRVRVRKGTKTTAKGSTGEGLSADCDSCSKARSSSDSLVIFLTGGIPKRQLDPLAIHIDIGDVVLKDGGNVDLRDGLSRLALFVHIAILSTSKPNKGD